MKIVHKTSKFENKFNKSIIIRQKEIIDTDELLQCKLNLNPGFVFVGFKEPPGVMIVVTNPEKPAQNL